MRVLVLHNKYRFRGGEDESSESEDRVLSIKGHTIFRHEQDNATISKNNDMRTAAQAIFNWQSFKRVRQLIRTLRPDVVDIHNFFPLISPSAHYACAKEGIPAVQTLHNFRLLCPGATLYRAGKPCEDCIGTTIPLAAVRHKCYRDSRLGSASVAGMLATHNLLGTWHKHVTLFIALSQFSRNKFVEAGLPAHKIKVKPNFVDPDPGVGDGSGNYLLFVGRLVREKGIETLLRAWRRLQTPVPLKIIGEGPLGDWVAKQCGEIPNVEWLGPQPVSTVYTMMGHAKSVVFPSEWYEPFGRVAVEAFAKGTPVIAADIGAVAEIVDEGRTGVLFKAGDADSLAAAVERFRVDHEGSRRMRREARQEFESKYTAERNCGLNVDIFREAIELSSKSGHGVTADRPAACSSDKFIRVF